MGVTTPSFPGGTGGQVAQLTDLEVDGTTLVVDETNNLVGIGTASPATALHVKSETGDTAIQVQAGSAGDSDGAAQVTFSDWQRTASIGLMSTDIIIAKDSSIDPLSDNRRVTINVDSGNVGIGHKFGQHRSPDGSASASVLNVENTTTSGSAQGGNIRLGSNDGAVMGSGHRLGVIEFAGSEAASLGPAGSAMAVGARIESVTDDTWSTTENGANLDFYTTDGDAVQTKRMTILADGNVGIGPTAPAKNLHVSKASGEATIRIQSAGYYSDIHQSGANLFIQNAAGGGNIIIYDDAAERMRIDTDGNVGIGDNAPGTMLQVKGTAPYVTLKNSTSENTEGGCESKVIFEDHADVTLAQIEGSHSGTANDTKGKLTLSTHTGSTLTSALKIDEAQTVSLTGNLVGDGSIQLKEKASAVADIAAYGQLWVKNTGAGELYFTTDTGTDIQITTGGTAAPSGIEVHLGETIGAGLVVCGVAINAGKISVNKAIPTDLGKCRGPFFVTDGGGSSGDIVTVLERKIVTGVDTSGKAVGDPVYLHTDGTATFTRPGVTADDAAFNFIMIIGRIMHVASGTDGIYVLEPKGLESQPLMGQVAAGGGTSTLVTGFAGYADVPVIAMINEANPVPGDDDQIKTAFIRAADGKLQITIDAGSANYNPYTYMIFF